MNKRWLNPSTVNGERTPEYNQWFGMLNRVKKGIKYYENVTVDDRFKDFDLYMSWAKSQKGFMQQDNGVLYQIDKDILGNGSGIYGPDTCLFIPPCINTLVRGSIKDNHLPLGVYERETVKSGLVYQCYARINGERKSVGIFTDYREALPILLDYALKHVGLMEARYADTVRCEAFKFLRELYIKEFADTSQIYSDIPEKSEKF